MGLFSGGGGYGQHNPEYRAQNEDLINRMTFGQMIADNPSMMQYFNSADGKKALENMGITSMGQLQGIQGMPSIQDYKDINSQIGSINPNINYKPEAYNPYQNTNSYQGYSKENLYSPSQSYNPQQFSLRDISNVPDQAYDNALMSQNEGAQRGFGSALAQLQKTMGSRGLGVSGLSQAEGSSLGRDYLQQVSDNSRMMSLQKAQEQMNISKLMQQMDFQRQQAQAGENQFGANFGEDQRRYGAQFRENQNQFGANYGEGQRQYDTQTGINQNQFGANFKEGQKQFGSQLQQYAKNFGLQKAQAQQQGLAGQTDRAMMPYNMAQGYFGQTAGLTGPPKTGGVIGKIGGAIGSIAGAAAPFF